VSVRRVSAFVIGECASFTKGASLRRAACVWPPRALSARCGACEPCLWHRCRDSRCVRSRSRGFARSRVAGDRCHRRRVTAGGGYRSAMPSIHREPLPRSALSSARLRPCLDGRLCRAAESSTSLASLESCDRSRPVPVHASRCRRDCASLDLGCRPTTSATGSTRGHTLRALDSSHASGALASPAARRHPRVPVALASTVRCRTGSRRATICARRLARVALH
jgi:hypothetical protein